MPAAAAISVCWTKLRIRIPFALNLVVAEPTRIRRSMEPSRRCIGRRWRDQGHQRLGITRDLPSPTASFLIANCRGPCSRAALMVIEAVNRRGQRGVSWLASWVISCPAEERSWPTPAVVWQAPSSGAAPIKASMARAIRNFVRMVTVLSWWQAETGNTEAPVNPVGSTWVEVMVTGTRPCQSAAACRLFIITTAGRQSATAVMAPPWLRVAAHESDIASRPAD